MFWKPENFSEPTIRDVSDVIKHGAWPSCGPHTPACWTTVWKLLLYIFLMDVPFAASLTLKIILINFLTRVWESFKW